MSSTDEQPNEEPQETEDLTLDDKQSEGVKGGAVVDEYKLPQKHGASKDGIEVVSFSTGPEK